LNKKLTKGLKFEDAALDFLTEQGMELIRRNYYCRFGEIDLIMLDKNCLIFVEVRYRSNTGYASAAESVTLKKQKKIFDTAQVFLASEPSLNQLDCRFDVIAFDNNESTPTINWLQNAFMES